MAQKLRVPPCPGRASGHAWQLAREHSTKDCQAEACEACGLLRMTSYRTGQIIRYEPAGDTAGTSQPAIPPEHLWNGRPGTGGWPSGWWPRGAPPVNSGCRGATTGSPGTPRRCGRHATEPAGAGSFGDLQPNRPSNRPLVASDRRLGARMAPGGVRRLTRSSPSCLNSAVQRTDFSHGLIGRQRSA